jgi:hypothetical protein
MAEFSWAYIDSAAVLSASGPTGSIQYRVADSGGNTAVSGSSNFIYHTASSLLAITGSVEISGTLTANQYNVNVIDKTVTNISASGDTIFGDTADDTHQFTGSMFINGPLSASTSISASAFYGDGSTLTGISATSISGAMGQFNTTSGLLITSGSAFIGDASSDVAVVAGQLTASQGALFNEQVIIVDDKNLVFGTGGDSIIKYDEASSDRLVISGSAAGTQLLGGAVIIDSPLTQITGAVELTGSGQSLLTLHTRDADALKEIVFLKDGSTAAAIQINSGEHLFIENENTKDIILRTNNQNALRVIGSQRRVLIGTVTKTSAAAELDVEGSAIISGTLTTTNDINVPDDTKVNLGDSADALIEFDSGTGRLAISGSATGIDLMGGNIGIDYPGGTVVSGTAGGAGSFLALNSSHQVVVATIPASDPFPYTGNIVGTGSVSIVSGSTQVFAVDSSDEGLGAVRGRMVQTIVSAFDLTNGGFAAAGRYVPLGNNTTISNTLSRQNAILSPFSGRLISITYHFPGGTQNSANGTPIWEFNVADVNQLNGNSMNSAVVATSQCTASSWPGTNYVGGVNVQNGEGTLGGTNTTGSWAFGTGSAIGLRFLSGDPGANNIPGYATVTTVWEFDQLDPYISGSGN